MNLTVKRIKNETEDILSIFFDKPKDFQFYPAQFIDLQVDIPNPDNSRIYSLSSSPTEEDLMITFKKGISDHKKKLQSLKKGDEVTITHPSGTYTLDESSPTVMLAGGVGIAPHRSMIKYAVDQKFKIPLHLIYSNRNSNFPFKNELELWKKEYPNLKIDYIETSKSGRLTQQKLTDLLFHQLYRYTDPPIFYLAGLPSFVEDMEKILNSLGIDHTNIRLDSFDGYN
jgi:ferredoxin-NADP reductase